MCRKSHIMIITNPHPLRPSFRWGKVFERKRISSEKSHQRPFHFPTFLTVSLVQMRFYKVTCNTWIFLCADRSTKANFDGRRTFCYSQLRSNSISFFRIWMSRNFVKSKSEPLLSAKTREATLGEMNETVRSTSGTMNVIKRGQDNGLQENSGHV